MTNNEQIKQLRIQLADKIADSDNKICSRDAMIADLRFELNEIKAATATANAEAAALLRNKNDTISDLKSQLQGACKRENKSAERAAKAEAKIYHIIQTLNND